MATTLRTKDRALGKEKRGTSPSNLQTSSRSSRQASSDKEKASEKSIRNYLKQTRSSSNEPLKLGIKKNNNTHEHNQTLLLRRRSFDKPPSASPRGLKALISPGSRDRAGSAPAPLVPIERKITVRSSSVGRHTVTATKAVADPRVSKTLKAVRSLPVGSKLTKMKSPSLVNKRGSSSNNAPALRKSSSSRDRTTPALDHETSGDHEAKQEDKEDLVMEAEEVINKVERDVHVVETEDETCASEDQNLIIQESRIDQETDEEKLHGRQVKPDTQQEDQERENINKEVTEETVIKENEEKGEDHENVNGSTDDHDDKVEEEKEIKEEAASGGIKTKEGDEVEGGGEEEGKDQDDDHGGAAKVQGGQEKESPSATYNDVIKETASKLLEKRKNKVRALVGAFETVSGSFK